MKLYDSINEIYIFATCKSQTAILIDCIEDISSKFYIENAENMDAFSEQEIGVTILI